MLFTIRTVANDIMEVGFQHNGTSVHDFFDKAECLNLAEEFLSAADCLIDSKAGLIEMLVNSGILDNEDFR